MALKLLLIKYRGVFAEHDMDVEDFSAVKHVIDTRPVEQRPRGTPLAFEGEEKNILKNFEKRVLFPGVLQIGRPLQCWLGRGMALSDSVYI